MFPDPEQSPRPEPEKQPPKEKKESSGALETVLDIAFDLLDIFWD